MAVKRRNREPSVARILIVDDEEAILTLLGTMLERAGHEVLSATSSDHALEILAKEKIEVAIIDLVMPGTGGLTLIMEHLAARPELGVVAMSGRLPIGRDSMRGLGSTLKIRSYLPKPFTADDLTKAISEAL